jgi:hypothetical protein
MNNKEAKSNLQALAKDLEDRVNKSGRVQSVIELTLDPVLLPGMVQMIVAAADVIVELDEAGMFLPESTTERLEELRAALSTIIHARRESER